MANAAKMIQNPPIRMLLTGFPGAGKTGAIASLANAGYKLRIMDFDGNPESLLAYTRPELLQNIDIVSLEDELADAQGFTTTKGLPTAFARGRRLLDRWKYEDADGVKDEKTGKSYVDLGSTYEWGPDTILVLDGLTGLSSAAMRRAQAAANVTPLSMTQGVWGAAMQDEEGFIETLTAKKRAHHVICISHLKLIGPKAVERKDDDTAKAIKEQLVELVPTRWYPTALGQGLAKTIAGHFPVTINIGIESKANKAVRRFNVQPREDMDLKVPAATLPTELSIENGLIAIFKALGAKPPVSGEGLAAAA